MIKKLIISATISILLFGCGGTNSEQDGGFNITDIQPINNAIIPTNQSFVAKFNNNLSSTSVNGVNMVDESGTNIPITCTIENNSSLSCQPKQNLNYDESYKLIFTNQITNVAGNPLSSVTYQYTTFVTPLIQSLKPANGSSISVVNNSFVVNFNESMNISTLNTSETPANVTFSSSDINVPINCTGNTQTQMTCVVSTQLLPNTSYNLTMTNKLVSAQGIAISPITFTYQTSYLTGYQFNSMVTPQPSDPYVSLFLSNTNSNVFLTGGMASLWELQNSQWKQVENDLPDNPSAILQYVTNGTNQYIIVEENLHEQMYMKQGNDWINITGNLPVGASTIGTPVLIQNNLYVTVSAYSNTVYKYQGNNNWIALNFVGSIYYIATDGVNLYGAGSSSNNPVEGVSGLYKYTTSWELVSNTPNCLYPFGFNPIQVTLTSQYMRCNNGSDPVSSPTIEKYDGTNWVDILSYNPAGFTAPLYYSVDSSGGVYLLDKNSDYYLWFFNPNTSLWSNLGVMVDSTQLVTSFTVNNLGQPVAVSRNSDSSVYYTTIGIPQ